MTNARGQICQSGTKSEQPELPCFAHVCHSKRYRAVFSCKLPCSSNMQMAAELYTLVRIAVIQVTNMEVKKRKLLQHTVTDILHIDVHTCDSSLHAYLAT